MKSPPRDTHFPQGTSSFFNDPWGGMRTEAQDLSLSSVQRRWRWGPGAGGGGGDAGGGSGPGRRARGGGRLLGAVRRWPIRRRGVWGEGRGAGGWGPPGFLGSPGGAACSFRAQARSPAGSPGARAGPRFSAAPPPFQARPPSATQTRLRRRPASSSGSPGLPAARVAWPLYVWCPGAEWGRRRRGRLTPGRRR